MVEGEERHLSTSRSCYDHQRDRDVAASRFPLCMVKGFQIIPVLLLLHGPIAGIPIETSLQVQIQLLAAIHHTPPGSFPVLLARPLLLGRGPLFAEGVYVPQERLIEILVDNAARRRNDRTSMTTPRCGVHRGRRTPILDLG